MKGLPPDIKAEPIPSYQKTPSLPLGDEPLNWEKFPPGNRIEPSTLR
jgi:hypothetical protein